MKVLIKQWSLFVFVVKGSFKRNVSKCWVTLVKCSFQIYSYYMILKQSSCMPKLLLVAQTYILCPTLSKFLTITSTLTFLCFLTYPRSPAFLKPILLQFFRKMCSNWNFIVASCLFYTICFVSPLPTPFEFWYYCRIYFCQKFFTVISVYLIKLIY